MLKVSDIPTNIIEVVKKCSDKNGKLSSEKARHLPNDIKEWFSEHECDMSVRTLFNLLKNNLEHIPFCKYCEEKQLTPKQYEKGHYYCCNQHAQLDSETKKKIQKTFEKYEHGHPSRDRKILDRIAATNMARYGATVAPNSEPYKKRIREECKEKYGVEHWSHRKETQDRRKETYRQNSLEKYGVDHPSKVEEIKQRMVVQGKRAKWDKMVSNLNEHDNGLMFISSLEDYIQGKQFKYRCNVCGFEFETWKNPSLIRCESCHPKYVSKPEKELADWIHSIYFGTVITSDRKTINPHELDILIPERNLAIEYNGTYWHSVKFREKKYHQKKTLMCKEKGIRLIHIPEHLWCIPHKQKILKSIIQNALGLNKTRIYARNTVIKPITHKEYSEFLDENHIQGSVVSKHRYGMFFDDELVSVFGYGISRFRKGETELHRFASKLGYSVIGGFSKFLKHTGFMGTTYVDMSYFNGNGYYDSGFRFVSYTEPSYIWIHQETGVCYSRYQTQKHRLGGILDDFDDRLTETENMEFNNFRKIFDTGNIKLIKE